MARFNLLGRLGFDVDKASLDRASNLIRSKINVGRIRQSLISKEDFKGLRDFNKELDNTQRKLAKLSQTGVHDPSVVNKAITKKLSDDNKRRIDDLRNNIKERDRLISGSAERTNKIITSRGDQERAKEIKKLREDILRRAQEADKEVADSIARNNKREKIVQASVVATERAKAKQVAAQARANELERRSEERLDQDLFRADRRRQAREAQLIDRAAKEQARAQAKVNKEQERQRKAVERERFSQSPRGFGQQAALAIRRFAAFSISAGGLFAIEEALRNSVREAISFEKQLVRLAQTTNTSVKNLGDFRSQIDSLSVGLGVASTELADVAVLIAQAGFSADETSAALSTLAKTSLSPSFGDIKNTAEGLIALRSQFNLTAEDFETQFSKINAVAKAFAVESEDIVTAIRKTGGAFKVASGDIDELIALFTAVRSTTRESADTIATGFRTIFARLQRPQVITELEKFNIQLRDTEGNFKGPLEAIKAIQKGLGDSAQGGNLQFARIAEQIGGIRQISKVVPLIQQVATAQKALNIARIGGKSLDQDATRAQESLANQLTKVREAFQKLGRDVVLSDAVKNVTSQFLSLTKAITQFANVIAPVLPVFLAIGIGKIGKSAIPFAQGFTERLGIGIGTRRQRLITGGLAAGAIGTLAGEQLAAGGPLGNRSQFLAGRAITGGAGFATFGGFTGAAVAGTLGLTGPQGAVLGAVVAGIIGALNSFKNALQEVTDAVEESKFRPVFTRLTDTLGLINQGRLTPQDSRLNLRSGLQALRDRRLTSTGDEVTRLNGEIQSTVESLLFFNAKLVDSVDTFDQFVAAGGLESLNFIADNTVLSLSELEKEIKDELAIRAKANKAQEQLIAQQEKLLQQAVLLNSLTNALADATDIADGFGNRLQNLVGELGVTFRGRSGFGQARLGSNLLLGAGSQLEGLLGGAFPGLSGQLQASRIISQQLPNILSEFALLRPSGGTSEDLETFVTDRLTKITGGSGKDLIERVGSAIADEVGSGVGATESKIVDRILEAPVKFAEEIFDRAGNAQIFEFTATAAQQFVDRFNAYSSQFAELAKRDIDNRRAAADATKDFTDQIHEVVKLQLSLSDTVVGNVGNLARGAALTNGRGPGQVIERLREIAAEIDLREKALQNVEDPQVFRALTESIIGLQNEAELLKDGFNSLLLGLRDDTERLRAEFDKTRVSQKEVRSGLERFLFAGRDERRNLNRAAVATNFVARDLRNINSIFINDELRAGIQDIANTFRNARLPGFGRRQGAKEFRTGEEFLQDLLESALIQGGLDPKKAAIAAEKAFSDPQKELLDKMAENARLEQGFRKDFLQGQTDVNNKLVTELRDVFDEFIKNFRIDTLQGQARDVVGKILGQNANRASLLEKSILFGKVLAVGGTGENTVNKKILDLAKSGRDLSGRRSAASTVIPGLLDEFRTAFLIGPQKPSPFTSPRRLAELRDQRQAALAGKNTFLRDAAILAQSNKVNINQARATGTRAIEVAGREFDLDKTFVTSLVNSFTEQLQSQAESIKGRTIGVTGFDFAQILNDALNRASEEGVKRFNEDLSNLNKDLQTLGPQARQFFDSLINLPKEEFEAITKTINDLGDAKLSDLNKELSKLNTDTAALTATLKNLNVEITRLGGQVAQVPQAVNPPAIQGAIDAFGNIIQSFIGNIPLFVGALNNFPKSVELQGTHKVEVIVNGASILKELQPGIEKLVTAQINTAISKFATNNLPGLKAFG